MSAVVLLEWLMGGTALLFLFMLATAPLWGDDERHPGWSDTLPEEDQHDARSV